MHYHKNYVRSRMSLSAIWMITLQELAWTSSEENVFVRQLCLAEYLWSCKFTLLMYVIVVEQQYDSSKIFVRQ